MNDHDLIAQASPTPRAPSGQPAPSPAPGTTQQQRPGSDVFRAKSDVSNNDLLIAGVLVVVLAGVFWFAKRALARHLIERRASPDQAHRTGLMLWLTLFGLSLSAVSAFIARKALFANTFVLSALWESSWTLAMTACLVVSLISFILFVTFLRSSRPN